MYDVEFTSEAAEQVAALPPIARARFDELVSLLEVAPWSATPYDREQPDANMRAHTFGTGPSAATGHRDIAFCLILDYQRRVVVLRVIWIG